MMKKWIAVFVALTATAGVLSSCGGKTESAEVPTVEWYVMKTIDNPSSQQMVEDELNSVLEKRAGAKLHLNLIESGAWTERMNLIINAGEPFDIVQTTPTGSTSVARNARTDSFMDVKDLLNEYGKDILAKQDSRVWDGVTFDGKILAIPAQSKWVEEYTMVFKKDLVEKYNFDYTAVKTAEDLEPYLAILKENEPDIIPLYITASVGGPSDTLSVDYTNTEIPMVYFDEKKEEYVSGLEAFLPRYRRTYEWFQKGYIARNANVIQDSAEGRSGRYAVLSSTGAYDPEGVKSSDYYTFPCVEVLLDTSHYIPQSSLMGGVAIGGYSEHPEEAVKVLNEIWKDPYLSNTMAYGIENVDYEVVSGETNEDKSVLPKSGSARTWCIWHNWVGPLFDQWDSPWNSKASLERMKKNNQTSEMSHALGFVADIGDMESSIAAITQVHSSCSTILQTGCMSDFDAYIEDCRKKLEAAGMNEVLAEMNKQYQEWKQNR